jgi:hypothetical protein
MVDPDYVLFVNYTRPKPINKICIKYFLPMSLFLFFNKQKMPIKSMVHNSIAMTP